MGAVDRQALGGVWSKAVRGSGMGVDCEQRRADTVFLDADASDVESVGVTPSTPPEISSCHASVANVH